MGWLERHAWWLLFATAVISVVFGLGDLGAGTPDNSLAVTGQSTSELQANSPAAYWLIAEGVRIGGVHLMAIGRSRAGSSSSHSGAMRGGRGGRCGSCR